MIGLFHIRLNLRRPSLAQNGPPGISAQCSLSGLRRIFRRKGATSVIDPYETCVSARYRQELALVGHGRTTQAQDCGLETICARTAVAAAANRSPRVRGSPMSAAAEAWGATW